MSVQIKIVRAAMIALALSLMVPVASKVLAQTETQSGYMVAWGDDGNAYCPDAGDDECP